jgi:signal transduction histidine kinase/CheY-like chemotaxis protein
VIRLRDGDALKSRATVGLEPEVASGFATPLEVLARGDGADGAEGNELVRRVALDGPSQSEAGVRRGARSAYEIALRRNDDVVGAVYLYMLEERSLSDDDVALLELLARHSAGVLEQYKRREALEAALLWRDEILGIVAHDLRNPLNLISMAANTLHQRAADSTARRPVERIIRAAQRADHLIHDLLEVSAIEGGRFSIETRTLESANTILAAIESQQALAATASVILASDLSPELPSVDADEERLLEVLENLIGNAVKFTNAGGSVTVGAACREDDILIWVKDSGQGIPPDHLPHLFDRFWQARKRDRRGTGLGLTICKAIVEAHGGRIWAESAVGVGTTVFFTIPAADARPARDTPVTSNILIVDDRPENILSLKAILERPDYRLVTVTSGEEALSLALREQFSVALIDVAMPGMDGLEVAVHMKELERSRDIPIIFITAFGEDPEEIHRAYSAGGADYLVKPLDAEIVRKKVAVFVDLSRRRQESERLPVDGNT